MKQKMYYMTKIRFQIIPFFEITHITQLVKASSRDNARKVVEKTAKDQFGDDIIIYEIRVDDTLIGD